MMSRLNLISNRASSRLILLGLLVAMTLVIFSTKYYLYAFVPALMVFGYFVLAKYPELGVYLLIFQIPFGILRKFTIAGFEVNSSWVIALLLLMVTFVKKVIYKESFQDLGMSLWSLLMLFMLVSFTSAGFSEYPDSSFQDLGLWLAALVYIALMVMLISKEGFESTLPTVLIFSVFISGLLGSLIFFLDLGLFADAQQNPDFVRNLGASYDPNNMSLMSIATLPLIIYRFLYADRGWKKWLYIGIFASNTIAIGTTYSRGGFLIFFIAVILMLIEYRHYIRAKYLGFLLLSVTMVIIGFVSVMPASFWERQRSIVDFEDSSLVRRSAYLYVAKDAFIENPVLGSGPNSFYKIFAKTHYAKIDPDTGLYKGRYAHNTYIEILVGMGLVGLILFLIILIKSLRDFTRVKQHYKITDQVRKACFIGSCRLFLLNVLIYLLIFSDTHHKYILVGLVMSQLALKYMKDESEHPESS